jgi:hypothetical protein
MGALELSAVLSVVLLFPPLTPSLSLSQFQILFSAPCSLITSNDVSPSKWDTVSHPYKISYICIFYFYYNQQIRNYIITIYITTVSLCNLHSYMFRLFYFIIREFTTNDLLSYLATFTTNALLGYLAKFTTNVLLGYLAKFTTNVLLSYLAKFTTDVLLSYLAKSTTNVLLVYLAQFTSNVLLSYLARFTTNAL